MKKKRKRNDVIDCVNAVIIRQFYGRKLSKKGGFGTFVVVRDKAWF